MATYRNSNDDEVIYLGSEFKLKVSMDPIQVAGSENTYNMGNVDFKCTFYTNNGRKVTLTKNQMISFDANTYIACLDSTDLGKGTLTVEYNAEIPDSDFNGDGDDPDGYRHETVVIPTKLKIK